MTRDLSTARARCSHVVCTTGGGVACVSVQRGIPPERRPERGSRRAAAGEEAFLW